LRRGGSLGHIADTLGHDGTQIVLQVYRHAVSPTIIAPRIMNDELGTRPGASPLRPE
jgi:hypothetical protein